MKLNKTLMYDAHTHFNDELYRAHDISVEEIVTEGEKAGVGYFNNVGFSLESSKLAIEQAKKFPNVFAVVGVHPNEVGAHNLDDLHRIDELASDSKVVAIGEVGLDYFYSRDEMDLQKQWLKAQIQIAIKHQLPLMLHIRDVMGVYDAYDDVLEILAPFKDQLTNVIVHCFSADKVYAQKFLAFGAYLEIGGAVTFNNAKTLQAAVEIIPLDKLLVETDAPYLTPHPFRGKINFSKNLPLTVEKLAEISGVKKEKIIAKTTNNAFEVFQLAVK